MTPSNLDVPRAVTRPTELPAQDAGAGTFTLTFDHKLGVVPSHVSVRFRAKADAANGVKRGMEFDLSFIESGADNGAHSVASVWTSDRQVIVTVTQGRLDLFLPDGTASTGASLAGSTYEVVVRVMP